MIIVVFPAPLGPTGQTILLSDFSEIVVYHRLAADRFVTFFSLIISSVIKIN